jgi:thioredoxin 1
MATAIIDAQFEAEVLKSSTPVLVGFWAPWCGPCKAMLPVIDELTKDYEGKVKIVKMNVDENVTVPSQYNVTSIPTFLLIKDGKVVDQFIGIQSKNDVKKRFDALLG